MAKPLNDDIIKCVQSALHRLPSNSDDEDTIWRDRMSARSDCPEPAKGRSTGYHNGRIGTGNVSYALHAPPFHRTYPLTPTPMTRRKMRKSHLVAYLPVFAGLASAQLVYPNCTSTGWDWASNSLGQNPCNVAEYLESTCGNGLFRIPPIPPGSGSSYSGPDAGGDGDNLCECNTVTYSLVSACGACQGSTWVQWSTWHVDCSTVSTAGTYPNPIPAGTRIPHWAYLDVSVADNWNLSAAQSAGDAPEASGTTSASASSTSGSSSSTSSSSKQKSSSTGAIAGGVVGGVLGLTLVVGLIAYFIRRRRWRAVARPSPFMTNGPHMDEAFGIPEPSISPAIPKYYDPSDPSTFPSTLPTSLASPSGTVIQTTTGSEQVHSPSTPSISTGGRNRYTGLPLV